MITLLLVYAAMFAVGKALLMAAQGSR